MWWLYWLATTVIAYETAEDANAGLPLLCPSVLNLAVNLADRDLLI